MRRFRTRAFTLVELLVVIGIIAILIAILMPALSRAKDQANGVKCAANLRQMMTGALLFAQDHKGHLFGNWSDAANPDEDKRDFLAGGTGDWKQAPKAGTLFKYIKDVNVYRCPSRDQEGDRTIGNAFTNGNFDYSACLMLTGATVSNVKTQSLYLYAGNFSMGQQGNPNGAVAAKAMAIGQDLRPTPVFVEETAYRVNQFNIEGGWSNVDEHSDHHRGGSYYASIDGSVHWFNPRKRALKSHDYNADHDHAEAWQWITVSPTRGEVQMGQYGKQWGWFDSTRDFAGS
jgi:prepilin-type N-terminal cleavage/methylation domain-containing protein